MSDSAPPAETQRYYDLCLLEGRSWFVFRFKDKGITLGPDSLEWHASGAKATKRFADIDGIRLGTGHVPKSGSLGNCQIMFRSGLKLTITSATEWGNSSDEQNGIYAAFVRDLHARLTTTDKQRIAFNAGNTPGRQVFGRFAMIVAIGFFVLLPLILLFITGKSEALWIMLGGLALVWPLVRTIQQNEPRTYNPDSLDADLFP